MKIDVPDFKGYECLGLLNPELLFIEDVCVLANEGDYLVSFKEVKGTLKPKVQVCYRKVKPRRIVFEATGETRPPKKGEWHKTFFGDYCKAEQDFVEPREIYRVVEDSEK
jgi:hypothetical protein